MSCRPSGTWVDCDHIGWNCSEIISPIVSLGCTLSADPNSRGLLQGVDLCSAHLWKFWPKVTHPCWFEHRRHSIANCRRMVTDSATVTMESLYETTIVVSNGAIADSLRPLLPPKWGSICPQDMQVAISPQRVIQYASCLVLGYGFQGLWIKWRYFRLH